MTKPQRLEQWIAALTVAGIVILAWFPLIAQLGRQPYALWMLMPVSLAMAMLSMVLVYDVAERMLGAGRGIYAAAVFCTVPAVGLAASDPAAMQLAALLFFNAVAVFIASRARGEERPYFIGMLALLLLAAGAFFGTIARVWALIVAIVLAVGDLEKRPVRILLGLSLYLLLVTGAALRVLIPLPMPRFEPASSGVTLVSALTLLPWALWIIPALIRFKSPDSSRWRKVAALLAPIALIFAALFHEDLSAVSVALAPALALLATQLVHEDFTAERTGRKISAVTLPALLTALALLVMSFLSVTGVIAKPVMGAAHVVIAIILAVALAWTALSRLARWAFFLLAATGVYFGLLVTHREPLFSQAETATAPVSLPFLILIFAAAVAAAITASLLKLRLFPGKAKEPDRTYRFAGENFVRFAGSSQPASVVVAANVQPPFSFAVFGDVVGAESLFATRRGGFFMFRALARALNESASAFAVSLGDLAREASSVAYWRLSRLLRRISVPLVVSPGNHDVFLGTQYNAEPFHRLFGADNGAFEIGPVRFVVLNNAWGFVGDPQFEWLENVLSGSKPFTLVFCHKPVFELRDGPFYAMETREHADRLHELFRSHGVTAVISGHIHSLLHEQRDGVTYIISGGGGSKLTSADDHYHYLSVDVQTDGLMIRALPLPQARAKKTAALLELRFGLRP